MAGQGGGPPGWFVALVGILGVVTLAGVSLMWASGQEKERAAQAAETARRTEQARQDQERTEAARVQAETQAQAAWQQNPWTDARRGVRVVDGLRFDGPADVAHMLRLQWPNTWKPTVTLIFNYKPGPAGIPGAVDSILLSLRTDARTTTDEAKQYRDTIERVAKVFCGESNDILRAVDAMQKLAGKTARCSFDFYPIPGAGATLEIAPAR